MDDESQEVVAGEALGEVPMVFRDTPLQPAADVGDPPGGDWFVDPDSKRLPDLAKAVDSCPDGHYLDVETGEIKPIISFAYDPAHETRGSDVEPDSIAHVVPQVVAVSTPNGVSEETYEALTKGAGHDVLSVKVRDEFIVPVPGVCEVRSLPEVIAEKRAEIAAEQKADALSGEVHKWSFMERLHKPKSPPDPFVACKLLIFRGGVADGFCTPLSQMPSDGLICFFANNNGIPEQAVYKIVMKEIERTEDERKAGKAVEWEWVAEYQGKRRYVPLGTVNGIRKGS